jgi:cholesterol oxidase
LSQVDAVLPRPDGGWQVCYRDLRGAPYEAGEQKVTAPVVVLAAGTLGSTELLLRSQAKGLTISDALGTRFSTNGDFSGFAVCPTPQGQPALPGLPDPRTD